MAITKNRQSRETISVMANKAFPDKRIAEIKELPEGMCNVAYDVAFEDGSKCILKIAAKDRSGNTSNEVNLMQAEINAWFLRTARLKLRTSFIMMTVRLYATETISLWKSCRVKTSISQNKTCPEKLLQ